MIESLPFYIAVAAGMIRGATPVLLAAVGECLTERAGILNLGLEGIMLAGALSAVIVSASSHSATIGIVAALITGALIGLVHAAVCIRFHANQVAAGIALTILLSGTTAYCGAGYVATAVNSLSAVKIPGFCDIPVAGAIFFAQDPLVYLCYLIVPSTCWLLNQTSFGLSLKACGEDQRSAAAAGINVTLVQCLCTMLGASLASLGGAYLSLVYAQGWTENITAGRGWIALALVMFAGWNPAKALIGACLFGVTVSLQLRLQAAGCDLSPYLLGMLPYLIVIAAMALPATTSRRKATCAPAALGVPYAEQA